MTPKRTITQPRRTLPLTTIEEIKLQNRPTKFSTVPYDVEKLMQKPHTRPLPSIINRHIDISEMIRTPLVSKKSRTKKPELLETRKLVPEVVEVLQKEPRQYFFPQPPLEKQNAPVASELVFDLPQPVPSLPIGAYNNPLIRSTTSLSSQIISETAQQSQAWNRLAETDRSTNTNVTKSPIFLFHSVRFSVNFDFTVVLKWEKSATRNVFAST